MLTDTTNLVSCWEVTGQTHEGDRFYGSYRDKSDAEFAFAKTIRNGSMWCRTVHGKRLLELRKRRTFADLPK